MASSDLSQSGHGVLDTPAGLTQDLNSKFLKTGGMYKAALALFGILFALGIIGFVIRVTGDGTSDKVVWGYYMTVLVFLLSTASAAPMVAIAPRIAKAHWRRSISRIAELWSAVGLLGLLMFIPMLWVLPSLEDGRRSFWFYFPGGNVNPYTPHIWSTASLLGLVVLGFALLWLSALPDLANIRDRGGSGFQQKLAAKLSKGWIGTTRQWRWLYHRMGIVGALYFLMLITVHFFITTDFLMTLVPGWIDALFPATHAVNSLQAGMATVMLTMWFMRKFGGYEDYITLDQFWGLGRLLFAISLLWVWFWFSSFNVFWYGKKPNEQFVLELFTVGPYLPVFFAAFFFVFLVPMWTMIWNPFRKSTFGPPIVAVSVLIGTFFDKLRFYVSAYSIPGIGDPTVDKLHTVPAVPAAVLPDFLDVIIIVGAISGAIFLFLLAIKVFPPINVWEQREYLLYRFHKQFHRIEVLVVGKPD